MAFNYANEADIAMLLAEVRKYVPFYAGCSTAASTAAKEINDLTGFSLRTGATIRVKFANSNTAQNPTLNVNNTGAKSIYKYGSSSAGITAGSSWESGAVVTLTYDGTAWIMNDWIDAEFSVMTGATSSTAGTSGLVPAPAAGSQEKYLKGDGTWGNPGGSRPIAYQLDTVTGTGGSYMHTTTDLPVTATMKATGIEVSDTTVFGGQITVTVNDGSITLSCPEVNGTSSVTVSVMQAGDAASGGQTVTSEEFDILSNRIGTMSALTTQTKTTVVGAVNEINQNVNNKVDRSDYDATKIPLSGTDSTSVKQALTNVDADIEKTQSGLAVIVDGDTCSVPVPADGYAYIKSNTHGLANGLYKNISGSAFPVSGGIADNTVFSAVPDGGLNDLKNKMGAVGATDLQSQITALNSNITIQTITASTSIASLCADIPINQHRYYKATLSSTFTDFPQASQYYPLIHIYKNTDSRANINIDCISASNVPSFITGYYENGSLYWNDINSNKATIKCKLFTATTSANGNIDIMSILNTNAYTIFAIAAHVKSDTSTMVVATPYQYSSGRPNKISGFHCIAETASGGVIASTEIEGMIFYVDNNTITQE